MVEVWKSGMIGKFLKFSPFSLVRSGKVEGWKK